MRQAPQRGEQQEWKLLRAPPAPDLARQGQPVHIRHHHVEHGDVDSGRVEFVNLDDGALQSLRDLGGADFLAEVIDAFLADAPELIATLRRSLDDGSTEELRRAAHTLKSNGATLGAEEFAELCRTLEQQAKSGELDGASELVERIEQTYPSLRDTLVALRSPA